MTRKHRIFPHSRISNFSIEQVRSCIVVLAEEWEILVKRARDMPGFPRPFQPKKFMQLCSAAHRGPVVVVNVHKRRCDALVIMAGLDEVMHIPLERFSYEKAHHLHQSLNQLLSAWCHPRLTHARCGFPPYSLGTLVMCCETCVRRSCISRKLFII